LSKRREYKLTAGVENRPRPGFWEPSYVLSSATLTGREVVNVPECDWRQIINVYGRLTGRYAWRARLTFPFPRAFISYTTRNPWLINFIESDYAHIAPDEWPASLKDKWGMAYAPSPCDVVNFPWSTSAQKEAPYDVVLLRAYCIGVPLRDMAQILNTPVNEVLRRMHIGINWYLAQSEFTFWMAGLDPTKIRLADYLGRTMTQRLVEFENIKGSMLNHRNRKRDLLMADPVTIYYAKQEGGRGYQDTVVKNLFHKNAIARSSYGND
jgi:hypothetical protein